jgi:undecaprenyl diphosphate synthase
MSPKASVITLPKGTKIPDHIALILDGNRRWARARGLHTLQGHKAGFEAGRAVAKAARQFGIHTFTVWGFSTENWDREPRELKYLMTLFKRFVKEVKDEAKDDGVRFIHLGRKDRLPKDLVKLIRETEEETRQNKKHVLNVALDYGGRDEILRAVKQIVDEGISSDKITEELFASYLDTGDQPYPYPDLFMRPSGEQRTSGLMPWQLEYAEYYWEQGHLPDMTPEKLRDAILDYSRRRRRFGGNDIVKHFKFEPQVTAKLELAWWRLKKIPEGTAFIDYSIQHLKEQYGMSKELAKEAALLMAQAVAKGEANKWKEAKKPMLKFYQLLKEELKLAFEPALAASLELKLWQDTKNKSSISEAAGVEDTAKELYAEVYRISLFQAAKLAHLRVLANIEENMAARGLGEKHWDNAEEYLEKFYKALKERVA